MFVFCFSAGCCTLTSIVDSAIVEMAVPGKKCLAKFNYVATDGEELTINKGEVLQVVDDKGPWWKVCNQHNKVGLVPSNYVEITAGQVPPPPKATVPVQQPANMRTNLKFDEKPNQYQQPDLMVSRNGPSLNIKAVAKFKYASTREDELSLEKGDDVIVMEKEADGWWRGRCGAKIGWFPFNYVEEVGSAETSSKDMVPSSLPPSSSLPPPPTQSKQKAVICAVVALYSFNSGNPEELAFEKGDLMDVIDQPPDDPDWWEARMPDGNTGLVPRNYVEMVLDVSGGGVGGGGSKPPNMAGMMAAAATSRSPAPFAREVWFHGKVARRDAENLLNRFAKNGEFVVRESETKVSVCLRYYLS